MNDLIVRYSHFVMFIAKQMKDRFPPWVCFDDLVSAGLMSVFKAIPKHDPSLGAKFTSFCVQGIRLAMKDEFVRTRDLPESWWRRRKRWESCRNELVQELRRPPDESEMANRLKQLPKRYQSTPHTHFPKLSFLNGGQRSRSGKLVDPNATRPEERSIAFDNWKKLVEPLNCKERVILWLHFHEGMTFIEIGRHFSLSRNEIGRIYNNAIGRIRERMLTSPEHEKSLNEIEISPQTDTRVSAANTVLNRLNLGTVLSTTKNGVSVSWIDSESDEIVTRRWQCREGQSFLPTWQDQWGRGEIETLALAQLVRWTAKRPVLPLATWRDWAEALGGERVSDCISILKAGFYPETTNCVLCDRLLEEFEWRYVSRWVAGPCCQRGEGCHQSDSSITRVIDARGRAYRARPRKRRKQLVDGKACKTNYREVIRAECKKAGHVLEEHERPDRLIIRVAGRRFDISGRGIIRANSYQAVLRHIGTLAHVD